MSDHLSCYRTLFTGLLVMCAGCGGSGSGPTAPTGPLAITGETLLTQPAETSQLKATASGGDVTDQATWSSSNNGAVTVTSSGVVKASAAGSSDVTASYRGTTATAHVIVASREDCSGYDPSTIQIIADSGRDGLPAFALVAPFGSGVFEFIATFATSDDGQRALAMAQRYRQDCFIGRGNRRADRDAYVTPYWQTSSGRQTTIDGEDCDVYNPASLSIANRGSEGWAVAGGTAVFGLLDTEADAGRLLAVMRRFANQCFIGRRNTRATPRDFMTVYYR